MPWPKRVGDLPAIAWTAFQRCPVWPHPNPSSLCLCPLHPYSYCRDWIAVLRVIWTYKQALKADDSKTDRDQIMANCHEQAAAILRQLFETNGGIYIKLGQHLGLLDYIIPEQYVKAMQVFFDRAPTSSYEDVRRVVQEDLGADIETLFSSFDFAPLASASLAQVHRAVLRDGREVAVKVQHWGLREDSVGDIYTVAVLVELTKRIFPDFNYTWLVEEIQKNLPRELNFVEEAANARRCAAMHADRHDVHIPEIVEDMTSSRVLTMEFCHGIPLTDVASIRAAKVDIAAISRTVTEMFSEQIFVHGRVHCDPHPGNVLVQADGHGRARIVLLDHGLYRELPETFRLEYCRLWRAIIEGDAAGIERHATTMNAGEYYPLFAAMLTYKPWDAVVGRGSDRLELSGSAREKAEVRRNVGKYLRQINALLARVPRDLLLLLKTNDCLHGLENNLRAALERPSDLLPASRPIFNFADVDDVIKVLRG
ncbi:uncharacterized protein MONBRDRAFT_33784 [Monosiga brevicollis MX1]|uniref:ABC1 atypical kinase-like domain-containing protein n=1 Tax=Monosiga brevicollis TaxID=81824 RepID=A9V7H6_MONBE|nr:uncharacterized protein MONBRDRAFT_33784 [Monosiga brevicollis MX1]EDQ86515.1 predicted protein [Monosiga brevicollis MX1]|eukprot:XP_001748628.1 hypothetical protein [Monosiga brevicollis MX1]